jgi:hypothetical protein
MARCGTTTTPRSRSRGGRRRRRRSRPEAVTISTHRLLSRAAAVGQDRPRWRSRGRCSDWCEAARRAACSVGPGPLASKRAGCRSHAVGGVHPGARLATELERLHKPPTPAVALSLSDSEGAVCRAHTLPRDMYPRPRRRPRDGSPPDGRAARLRRRLSRRGGPGRARRRRGGGLCGLLAAGRRM